MEGGGEEEKDNWLRNFVVALVKEEKEILKKEEEKKGNEDKMLRQRNVEGKINKWKRNWSNGRKDDEIKRLKEKKKRNI